MPWTVPVLNPNFGESPKLLNDENAGYDGFHIHEIAR
jgi:hypothetical protein